jgi:predicted HicB family RNase H-like nuclease
MMTKRAKTQWEAHQLVLRIDDRVKDAMRARAGKEGLSMNAWANRALARAASVKLLSKKGERAGAT